MNPFQIMSQLFMVVEKNIKRLMSSKVSASVIILGPLLMIAIIGVAFQSSDYYGIKVGVYAKNYDDIANKIIDAMSKNHFEVQKTNSSDECINKAKNADVHLCIIFPEDYNTGRLEFYVDYSRVNLVYVLISRISDSITSLSSQISVGMTQDILNSVDTTAEQLGNSEDIISNMTGNAKMMVSKMNSIRDQLIHTNIDTGSGTLTSINNQNSQLNQNIAQAKTELSTMKTDAVTVRDKLTPAVSSIDLILVNMNKSQATMGCTDNNSVDLTPYITDNSFATRLAGTPNPACALIYTFKSNLGSQESDLKNGLDALNQMISDADNMQSQISSMETNVRSDSKNAVSNLASIQATKVNLTIELDQMSKQANDSIKTLEAISSSISSMNQGFDKMGVLDAQNVIRPIKTTIKSLVAKKQNTLDVLFPALILMVVMFVSILLGNVLIMREKMSKAYFRNRILPAKNYIFILGTYLTSLIIALIQAIIIIIIGITIFHTNLEFNLTIITLTIILASVLFTSIGMVIGYITNSEETSTLVAIIIAIIFLLFSNILIPIESMSRIAGIIAGYTPFSMTEVILRRAMIFGTDASTITGSVVIALIIESVLLLVAVYLSHVKFFNRKI